MGKLTMSQSFSLNIPVCHFLSKFANDTGGQAIILVPSQFKVG